MTATATAPAERANAPSPTPSIELDTSADYALVARELVMAADDLKSLAKKLDDAGYLKEGKRVRGDAEQLLSRIAPKFQPQAQIEFEQDGLTIEDQIERAFLADIRNACQAAQRVGKSQGKATQEIGEDDLESIVTRCAKKLALRASEFGHECAERGVWAGQAVREIEESDVVRRAIAKLIPPKAE